MKSTHFMPIAVLAFAVACNDSGTAPDPNPGEPSLAITFKPRTGPTVNFQSNTSSNLAASIDISGLGNLPNGSLVKVEVSAFADALYACRNNGGNFPSDPKKQDVATEVKQDAFLPVKNGRASGTVILSVPGSTLDCPGGQTAVLVSITWSDVQVEVVDPPGPSADSSSPGIQDTYSRTFFTL